MPETTLAVTDAWVVYDRSAAMFPGLAYAPDGSLLVSYSTVADGLPGGEIHVLRSHDEGWTWGAPQVVAQSRKPQGAADNALSLTALRDGTLLLAYEDVRTEAGFGERHATLYILRSTDGGHTWQNREPVMQGVVHEPFTYGQVVELAGGTLVCPVWGRYRREEHWRAAVIFSRDGGRSWGDYTSVAYDPQARLHGEYVHSQASGFDAAGQFDPAAMTQPTFRPHSPVDGFNETSLILLPGGRLLAVLRQQGVEGRQTLDFYRALSDDGGRTWTPYQRTNLCGMSPCLHRTPSGQLLLGYRRCAPDGGPAATPGLSIAVSHDDGLTWAEALTLREPKGTRYTAEYQVGYPAMVNRRDGSILVVYYSYDEALPHRRYLAANLLRETE